MLAWLIPEVALKETTRATDTGETFAMPSSRTSAQELERALSVLANRVDRRRMYQRLAESAAVDLSPFSCWMLIRLGSAEPATPSQLAQRLDAPLLRLQPALDALENDGYVTRHDGILSLTRTGAAAYARLVEARRKGLETFLRGWSPEQQTEMAGAVRSLAERFLSDDFGDALLSSQTRLRAATHPA